MLDASVLSKKEGIGNFNTFFLSWMVSASFASLHSILRLLSKVYLRTCLVVLIVMRVWAYSASHSTGSYIVSAFFLVTIDDIHCKPLRTFMSLPLTQQGFVILVHHNNGAIWQLSSECLGWVWTVLHYTVHHLLFQCLEHKSTSYILKLMGSALFDQSKSFPC